MALVRVAQYNSTPTVVGDYQAQNAHLQAFTNQLLTQQFILDSGTAQPVIKQGCYVSHGGSLYVADADTAITGSPADGSVYIRVSGTTTLTVEFINNISGYTWNPVYTALTSGSYTLLPYLIVKASTVWTRYNFNPNNQQFGAVSVDILTPNKIIPVELYSPEFMIYDGLKPIITKIINSQSGDILIYTSNITQEVNQTTYTKYLESTGSIATGTIKVSFALEVGSTSTRTIYGKIYVNGVPVGTERSVTVTNSTGEQTFVEDISVQYGDIVQIYSKLDALSPVGVRRVSALSLGTNVAINL